MSFRQIFFLLLVLLTAVMLGCGGSNGATLSNNQPGAQTPAAPSNSTPAPTSGTTTTPSPSPTTPAPTIQLSANPPSIIAGQTSTLNWTTTDTTSVSIQPGSYTLGPSGPLTVQPTATTTYVATATGAGGSISATATVTVATPPSPAGYAFGRVVIVALENKNYSTVVGNTSSMPYLNSLIASYGLATYYYANTHPSIGNYFMLTTGQIITNDDAFGGVVSADNVVRQLNAAGKTWRSYAEDLPYAGYLGGDTAGYVQRHNPLKYFSDVQNNPAMAQANIVPFTQFATDLAAGKLPQYTFVVPNIYDDAHECPNGINACQQVADNWLKANMGPLLADATFQKDGVLIVWFDESDNDNTHGGGHVPLVMVSPAWSKAGYQSTTFGQHQNTLRFTMDALGVTSVPGATATGWNEFFNAH